MHTNSNPRDQAYPLVIWIGDRSVDRACLGDFIGGRRTAASAVRRAEIRCLMAALLRRLRLLAARTASVAGRQS